MSGKRYSHVKPGDTVQGAAGKVQVKTVETHPNGALVFRGTRPSTNQPATTWGQPDAEVTR